MKSELSSVEIHYLVKELDLLIDSRIDKIFQAEKNEFYFQFYVTGAGKKILKITDKLVYLTEIKPEIIEPPGFCMYLRKHLNNARLRDIKQKGSERIIELIFEKKDDKKKVLIELFGGGNLLLLDENNIILSGAHYEKYKDREILPKKKYSYPKREYNFFDLTKNDLTKLFNDTKKESLVKSLALDLGFGGTYSEELCLLSGVKKETKPKDLSAEEIGLIFSAIKKLTSKKPLGIKVHKSEKSEDIVPFNLKLYEKYKFEEFKTFNEALNKYFSKEQLTVKKSKSNKKLDKFKRIIDEQEKTIRSMIKKEEDNRKLAEIIYNNYSEVKDILSELKKAKNKYSSEEIKEKLKGHKVIKEIKPKEKQVVLDL